MFALVRWPLKRKERKRKHLNERSVEGVMPAGMSREVKHILWWFSHIVFPSHNLLSSAVHQLLLAQNPSRDTSVSQQLCPDPPPAVFYLSKFSQISVCWYWPFSESKVVPSAIDLMDVAFDTFLNSSFRDFSTLTRLSLSYKFPNVNINYQQLQCKKTAIGFSFQKPISAEAQSVVFSLTPLIYDLILLP